MVELRGTLHKQTERAVWVVVVCGAAAAGVLVLIARLVAMAYLAGVVVVVQAATLGLAAQAALVILKFGSIHNESCKN
jgi:hypothetical protein